MYNVPVLIINIFNGVIATSTWIIRVCFMDNVTFENFLNVSNFNEDPGVQMQNNGKRKHIIRNPAKFIVPYTEKRIPCSLYYLMAHDCADYLLLSGCTVCTLHNVQAAFGSLSAQIRIRQARNTEDKTPRLLFLLKIYP
jgi:hypothetical protein